jgi:hypothetical protein
MLDQNREFRHLKTFIGQAMVHLIAMGRDLTAMTYWYEHRFGIAEADLDALLSSSQVNAFVSDYAASLRKSLEQLFASGSWDVLEEIPMDYVEELLLQARSYAEMTKTQPSSCQEQASELLNVGSSDFEPAVPASDQSLAEAA